MIINGITELRALLPSINLRDDSNRLNDHLLRAQQWVSGCIIGSAIETALEETPGETDSHEILRLLVKRVIAAKAYLFFGDEMNLQLGEAGMVVQNNEAVSAASFQRRDNLIASLEIRLDNDCDSLVDYLLTTSASGGSYAAWRSSSQFESLTAAFIPTLKLLRFSSPAGKNDIHFGALLDAEQNMNDGIMQIASSYCSSGEILQLLESYREGSLNSAQMSAVRHLRCVAGGWLANDLAYARQAAIRARNTMLSSLEDFSVFDASTQKTMKEVEMNEGHIVNLL